MTYPDKYQMTIKQAKFFAHKNLVNLIYDNSKFEGTQTTLPQTQTIVDGMSVAGVSTDDVVTIVTLKRAWQFVIANAQPYTIEISNKINAKLLRPILSIPATFAPKTSALMEPTTSRQF